MAHAVTAEYPYTPTGEGPVLEAKVQRLLIWLGPLMLVLWLVAFAASGFLPPHRPSATSAQITQLYNDHPTMIRVMMVITMAASALLVPWCVAIAGQIRRIPGAKALATTQMISCSLLSLEFIYPVGIWMTTAFRSDDRPIDITRAFNDMGWILFVLVIWSVWVQMLAIAAAVLLDKHPEPVLPRWVGYLSLWVALIIIPAGLVLFFKTGPWAWNGVVGFWIPLTALVTWMLSMTWTVHQALNKQIAQGAGPE
ncbi:hypothetical protein BOO86_15695 [Mycobacterium sp. CBMA 234]|uniref:hypothetical protein n=1 Tax=Mycolicibacterium sp. CBMA 234 TaxID=1918495 RepID=UPI0012DE154D|nr:hypothetical protein [Mycolicibacterium sp. CBMA 234]MUL65919.1 hypothetical protein [Mycolicibacterium sp. CBMA 234]